MMNPLIIKSELTFAIIQLSNRGLYFSSKWAAELLNVNTNIVHNNSKEKLQIIYPNNYVENILKDNDDKDFEKYIIKSIF